jgi:trigger factor
MPDPTDNPDPQTSEATEAPPPAATLPENAVDVRDAGTLRKKITITVPRARIDAKYDEMFGELGRTAQVPGFRVGRAPRRLIERRFGKDVAEDVRNAMVAEAVAPAIEKAGLKTLGEPEIDLDAITLPADGDLSFSFEVEVMPEFDLPELEGIEVRRQKIEMTDERVEEYLEQIRLSRAHYEQTDKPAAEGDAVLAGAKISGEGLTALERHGLTLRVAPGQIEGLPLVDLGKALAGVKAGGTATLTVQAGQAHPNKDWVGKTLTVQLDVSQVRRRILPDVDEALATSMGFGSLDELRSHIRQRLAHRLEEEVRQSMRDQVCQYLLDRTTVDLPEGATARTTARLLQRRVVDLMYRGVSSEQIQERLTELQAGASEQAKERMKLSFILAKIAGQQKVQVEEGEVNASIAQLAAEQNRRPDRLRQELAQDGTLSAVEDAIRENKVLDGLLAQAKIVEVAPGEVKPAARPAKAEAKKPKAPKAAKAPKKKPPARPAAKKATPKGTGKDKGKARGKK